MAPYNQPRLIMNVNKLQTLQMLNEKQGSSPSKQKAATTFMRSPNRQQKTIKTNYKDAAATINKSKKKVGTRGKLGGVTVGNSP